MHYQSSTPPSLLRSSRVAYALTTQRAFVSTRTMFCSINTDQVGE